MASPIQASSSLLYGAPRRRAPQAGTDLLRVEDELRSHLEAAEAGTAEDRAALVDFLWQTDIPPASGSLAPLESYCGSLWKEFVGMKIGFERRLEIEAFLARLAHRIRPSALPFLLVFYLDDPFLEAQHDYLAERLGRLVSGSQVELERKPIRVAEHRLGVLHTTHWQAASTETAQPRCLAGLEASRRAEALEKDGEYSPLIELSQLSEDGIGGEVVCGLCKMRFRQHPASVARRRETPDEWVVGVSRVIGPGAEARLREDLPRRAPISREELGQAVRMALWSVVVGLVEDAFAGSGGPLLEHEHLESLRAFWDPSVTEPPALPGPDTAVLLSW